MCLVPALLALFMFWQQSEPPTPSKVSQEKPGSTSNKKHEDSPTKEHFDAAPTSRIVTNTSDNPSNKQETKPSTDLWLTGFTGALVLVAVLQFIAMHRQAEYMRKGLRISIRGARGTKQAAIAAKASADALMNIERPWIMVSEATLSTVTFQPSDDPGISSELRYSVNWKFKNFGKTPAFIKDVGGGSGMVKTPEAPPRSYELPLSFPPEPILAPGQVSELMRFISDDVVPKAHNLTTLDSLFFFYGRIEYTDPFGRPHSSTFRYVYDFRSGHFKVRWDDPNSTDNKYT